MEEKNTVTVIVYGQEYTLSGDMPREYIMKIADHVDAKMREVGDGTTQPTSSIAVLAGMLIADEYFKQGKDVTDLLARNAQLDMNAKNYEKMWEDVKSSFAQYKEEMSNLSALKDRLSEYASEKEKQASNLAIQLEEEKQYASELKNKIDALMAQVEAQKNVPSDAQKHIDELENRCRDIESSFFDIQMENIHLKNEIETLRSRR